MIMRNTFREALNGGKPTIGTHFLFSDPDIAELTGNSGLFIMQNLLRNIHACTWSYCII